MTVAEVIATLTKLPQDAQVCYMAGDRKETILEACQVEMVDVNGDDNGYYAAIGQCGDRRVAVIV